MRIKDPVLFVTLTVLICGLLSQASVTAEKMVAHLDGRVYSANFFKTVPAQLNYQGCLINAADSSAVTATLEMTFRLFDSETKGAELWAETHPAVEVQDGLFQVLLGSVTAFSDGLFDATELWLQTEVGTEVLSPRKPIVSVAYSQRAGMADQALQSDDAGHLESQSLVDLDNRWVNEEDLDHLDAADGDPAEAVYIDADGKVGVGTTSPLTELDVNGSVNATTYYGDGSHLTGISGTTDNDWTIDGDNVYHQTGNVGIGTTTPSQPLDVAGAVSATTYYGDGSNLTGISGGADTDWTISGSDMYSGISGNVGIGTTNPQRLLHMVGVNPRILIEASSVNPEVNFKNSDDVGPETWALYKHGTNDDFRFYQSGDKVTIQNGTGNVGIGTANPATKLHLASAGDTEFRMTHDNIKNLISFYQNATKKGFIEKDDAGGKLTISANGDSAHLTIVDSTGQVGIGTSSPSRWNKLEVSGASSLHAIHATHSSPYGGAAIWAIATGSAGDAIYAEANGGNAITAYQHSISDYDYAIVAVADSSATAGFFAGYPAGYFLGDLHCTGAITGGTKSFLIDHPLDPLNKTLMHYCIESPEPLLVYKGRIEVNGNGETVVQMPEYFVALTKEKEACINLTPVGQPFLTGVEWNSDYASFTIYGEPNREVYYTVYADRDDPVMRQLHRPVEQEKGDGNFARGKLLYPEAYGYPKTMAEDYEKSQIMQD